MMELPLLYHLATADAWDPDSDEPYAMSTRGRTLEQEGFVHLSLARQVKGVAKAFYGDADVVLMRLDPHRLGRRVVFERAPDVDDEFPHIYGPIPREAIVAADPVPRDAGGELDFTGLLPQPL